MKGGNINLNFNGIKIGFAITGAFSTFNKTIKKMNELVKRKADVIPIMSYTSYNLDTKYGKAQEFVKEIEKITGKKVIHTIEEAENVSVKEIIDIMIIAPCSRKYNIKASM